MARGGPTRGSLPDRYLTVNRRIDPILLACRVSAWAGSVRTDLRGLLGDPVVYDGLVYGPGEIRVLDLGTELFEDTRQSFDIVEFP